MTEVINSQAYNLWPGDSKNVQLPVKILTFLEKRRSAAQRLIFLHNQERDQHQQPHSPANDYS